MTSEHILIPANVIINAGVTAHFVAKFVLFTSVLLTGTICIGRILRTWLGIPQIAGQIVGGIVLGPSLINLAALPYFLESVSFTDDATSIVYQFASSDLFVLFILLISAGFTVAYLLWVAGHETDLADILKVGITATGAGIFGALMPIIMIAGWLFWVSKMALGTAVGIGIIFAATSVSIPVALFFAQNKMHLKSSKATLGAAIIDDIFAVILLSLFMIGLQTGLFGKIGLMQSTSIHSPNLWLSMTKMVVSFIVFGAVGYFVMVPLVTWIRRKERVYLIAATATIFMFVYFAFAELFGGLAGITGAYFAGIFHRLADQRHYAVKAISPYVNSILLPLFLGSIGLQLDLRLLGLNDWGMVLVLTVLAVGTKFMGTYLATGLSNLLGHRNKHKWSSLESYIFSSAMVARGEVGLVVATLLRSVGLLGFSIYTISVVVIVLTTIISPILLTIGFRWLESASLPELEEKHIINLGRFKAIGTMQMFNIVMGVVQASKGVNTTVQLSEGRQILNLEDLGVKIIYIPEQGIILEGNKNQISDILRLVHSRLTEEVEGLVNHP